jgi:hypothetical protein
VSGGAGAGADANRVLALALAVLLVDYNGTPTGCFGDWPGRAESS